MPPEATVVEKELRIVAETEIRARGGDKPGVEGYAAKFNVRSVDLGGFVEQIAPGTFARSVKEGDVPMLFSHDSGRLLARTSSGTLRLEEDTVGLRFEADLPDTQDGRDLMVLLDRKDLRQMSFGFRMLRDEWNFEGPIAVRTLRDVELLDISPVTFPAYPDTTIAKRSLEEARKQAPAPTLVRAARLRLAESELAAS